MTQCVLLQVEIPPEIVTEVLVVASQLAMQDLVCCCEAAIKDAVDVDNGMTNCWNHAID